MEGYDFVRDRIPQWDHTDEEGVAMVIGFNIWLIEWTGIGVTDSCGWVVTEGSCWDERFSAQDAAGEAHLHVSPPALQLWPAKLSPQHSWILRPLLGGQPRSKGLNSLQAVDVFAMVRVPDAGAVVQHGPDD